MKLYYNDDLCPRCNQLTDHYNGKWCKTCHLAYMKVWRKEHVKEYRETMKKWQKVHAKEWNDYQMSQRNEIGKRLGNVRDASSYYLFKTLKHNKLKGYEIHHCFGYDDHTKFVYIPKTLHFKIHQYLRNNKIDAKSNHYNEIVQMINECTEYTYIHV